MGRVPLFVIRTPYSLETFHRFTRNFHFCKSKRERWRCCFLKSETDFSKVSLNLMLVESLLWCPILHNRKICPLKPWIITVPHYFENWSHTLDMSTAELLILLLTVCYVSMPNENLQGV